MHIEELFKETSLNPESLGKYLKRVQPPLDPGKVSYQALAGGERAGIKIPLTGQWSLVLSYKDKPAAVASLEPINDQLHILQLQGSNSRVGFRLSMGLRWPEFFADQIYRVAAHPESPIRRLILPMFPEGTIDCQSEGVMAKYRILRDRLGLVKADHEPVFYRDLATV